MRACGRDVPDSRRGEVERIGFERDEKGARCSHKGEAEAHRTGREQRHEDAAACARRAGSVIVVANRRARTDGRQFLHRQLGLTCGWMGARHADDEQRDVDDTDEVLRYEGR